MYPRVTAVEAVIWTIRHRVLILDDSKLDSRTQTLI